MIFCKRDFSPRYEIIPLPCGCVSNVYELVAHPQKNSVDNIVECPWCDSTFVSVEFAEWIGGEASPMIVESRPPRDLALVDGCVLEVVGACPCGTPIVCARHGKPFHPHNDLVCILRN